MQLRVFHSDKGDCTLVTGKDGRRILADGGMSNSYSASVAPLIAKIAQSKGNGNKKIDVVYVSHIDDDHIGGVLKMLDDLKAWVIHDFKAKNGGKGKAPTVPRPPQIGEIWHNGFRDMLKDNAGPIEDQLASSAILLSGLGTAGVDRVLAGAIEEHQDLAESVKQAIQLGSRISDGQLGIPLNPATKAKLLTVEKFKKPLRVGGMEVFVLAPFQKDLEVLRTDWNKWLRANQKAVQDLRSRALADESDFGNAVGGNGLVDRMNGDANAFATQMMAMVQRIDAASADAKKIGKRTSVTPPNLASTMLLLREGQKTILLTGDGFGDDAVKGLDHYNLLTNGGIHVNVLKVQHHGSEHNMTDAFAMSVTADDYVFCGNGFSTNPEPVVIQRLFDSRLGSVGRRSKNPEVAQSFRFWFNCSGTMKNQSDQKKHMQKVVKLVAKLVKQSSGKMKAQFLADGATATFDLPV